MQMQNRSERSRTRRAPDVAPAQQPPPPRGHSPTKASAPLTNVAGTGLIRRGEETVLVKTDFLWWVKVLASTDPVELQRAMWRLSSNTDEWYLHTYMDSVKFFH